MTLLLNAHNLSKTYSSKPLFSDLSLSLFQGDQIGLVGPNGVGKSTLLKILGGQIAPDEGIYAPQKGLRIVYLAQSPSWPKGTTLMEAMGQDSKASEHEKKDRLSQFGFSNPEMLVEHLSGGMQKRLALAHVFGQNPDLLLLDEPTNHLDLEGIYYLEQLLKSPMAPSWMVITHDRRFLDTTPKKIMELNPIYPDGLFISEGTYEEFLIKKDAFLEAQEKREASLENKVRRETEWLRQGVKARTTKSSARIQEAYKLQDELGHMKKRLHGSGSLDLGFDSTERKTKRLLTLKDASYGFFQNQQMVFSAKERYGLLGSNGVGKTTFLKILAGLIPLEKGLREEAPGLKIVYFDQMRESLDGNQTVRQVLCPHGGDSVVYRNQSVHLITYGLKFQFKPEDLDKKVELLSGGQKARLLMARLMLTPGDLLLLDEPTNDLDMDSLEALEENLEEYPGCLVLVTHDRHLIETVCTSLIGPGENGQWETYASIEQWQRRWIDVQKKEQKESSKAKPQGKPKSEQKKWGFKEEQLWNQIEGLIESKEAAVALKEKEVEAQSQDHKALSLAMSELIVLQKELDELYAQWASLEALRS